MAFFLSKLVDILFRYLEWDENEKSLRDEGSGDGVNSFKNRKLLSLLPFARKLRAKRQ